MLRLWQWLKELSQVKWSDPLRLPDDVVEAAEERLMIGFASATFARLAEDRGD